ncbi:hypothetical protein JVT61DRAFT_15513 [Boletus reticuloceps]|uniref:CHAT domain-containing protein n=1 Tax=Boletus reticuloceps TaxID=495285 RepID=A0A8I2YC78_9AGAM|nr:hypothetical protein JVT61DRAFT_15513 [Boletus reticuloceps]
MQGSTPQHVYAANLKQEFGYPLRTPKPNSRLGQPYVKEGLQIGDVGFVDDDGEFIWLFNSKFPLSDSDKLEKLPEEFHNRTLTPPDTFIEFPEPVLKHGFDPETVFTFGVERNLLPERQRRATYEFTATSKTGAILILPGGATLSKLEDKQKLKEFRQHATKYALQWCQYAERDSLYLITAAYKTKTWTLGSFYEGLPGKEILVHQQSGENTTVYRWEHQFNVHHRQGPGDNDGDNQTVLVQGFRITMRWDWLRMIERVERPERWFARVLATFWPIRKSLRWLSQTKIEHVPTRNLSQPVHPLDVINRVLLDKNPRAKVAVTHDNAWIEMLENGLSHADLMQEDRVREFIQDRYTWDLDPEHSAVYLRSKPENTNSQIEPECNPEDSSTLSPLSDDPRFTVTNMRLENIDIDRIHAGVSILIQFGNTTRRTENKPHASVIEWDDLITLPSDLPINVTVCAAFQLGSMLGTRPICTVQTIDTTELTGGTQIVRFSVGKVESCSSLLITLVRHVSYSEPHWSDDEDSVFVEQTKLGFKALYSHHDEPKNEYLEDSLECFRRALEQCGLHTAYRATALFNLATARFIKYRAYGTYNELNMSIALYGEALKLRNSGDPDRAATSLLLAQALVLRYGQESDESTVMQIKDILADIHPDCSRHHRTADIVMRTCRFYQAFDSGNPVELDELLRDLGCHAYAPPYGFSDRPHMLYKLSVALWCRFQRLGELGDLELAISTLSNVIGLTPHGHPDQAGRLNNLGGCFLTRFERLGELSDLEDATSTHRDAVDLTPDGHLDKPSRLSNLGNSFRARFLRLGELSDLEDAISTLRDAVDLTPDGHPDKPRCLSNLGNSFTTRFERFGELSDFELAIAIHREAVDLTPDGHPDKPSRLNNLGSSFRTRFERLGELRDLEDAISTLREAVDLTPDGHPDKPGRLNNLGNSFRVRFKRLGELRDLEDAISTHRDAVDLTPDGHPDKPSRLSNFGISFRARFERIGEPSDLEHAISTHRDAVVLTPDGHPDKPSHLNKFGISFRARFERLGELRDLEDAISTHKEAVDLTPHGHPHKPGRLSNLGLSFTTRFEHLEEPSDLEDAITLYSHSASVPIGPISVRFHASQNWILWARRMRHPSLLRAHSIAINLLPQLAWIGLSLTHRYAELKRNADVAREAAAAALDSGFPELAVEWLEQGRSIVWGELLQLRGSYEQLSSAHPDHACRLRELSAALEGAAATREKHLSTFSESTDDPMHRATLTLQQVADTHRTLAIERDKLLQEIRRLSGFERFLLPKDFSQLRASAHSGPVVILNAAETRCDALILLSDVDHVIHVPLPNFTAFQRSTDLQGILKSFLRNALVGRTDQIERWDRGTWESFLSPLWKCVVEPVMDALAFSMPGELSRIFWCPTGPFVFLPIHAAGLYDAEYSAPGHKVFDFVVSSYVPTLSILAPSRNTHMAHNDDFRLLAVRQPTDGSQLSQLPGAHTELEHIKKSLG